MKVQPLDQAFLVLSESYALWKELAAHYYSGEQVPCSLFCRGVYASDDELHGLHGYLECSPSEHMALYG